MVLLLWPFAGSGTGIVAVVVEGLLHPITDTLGVFSTNTDPDLGEAPATQTTRTNPLPLEP